MRRPLMWGCLLLVAIIALWMYIFGSPIRGGELFLPLDGKEVLVTGQVYQKEVRSSYGQEILSLYLKSISFSDPESKILLDSDSKQISKHIRKQKIICEIKPDGISAIPSLGEYVRVSGEFTLFSHATNDGEFDSANYYGVLGINGKIKKGIVEGVRGASGQTLSVALLEPIYALKEILYQTKHHLKENLYHAFSEREASLLCKMLLGDGTELDSEIKDLYMRNGIVHILSISGLHISMLGMGVYKGLRKLTCPMKVAAVVGAVFILLYGGMTGFGVSVCRAVGMYGIHMLGEIKRRTYDMPTAMGMLACSMVLVNPRYVFHSGFLLSFGSVAAIGCLLPALNVKWREEIAVVRRGPIERLLSKVMGRERWKRVIDYVVGRNRYWEWRERKLKRRNQRRITILQGFHVSLAVTVMTLPVQLYFFFQMPRYSVILNMLVIPLMGIVMGVGIVGMLFPFMPMVRFCEGLFFDWYEWLCLLFEKLPGSIWITGRPAIWKMVVYYCVLLTYVLFWRYCAGSIRRGAALRYLPLLVLIFFLGTNFRYSNAITFLDVGQGDCIVLETKEGRNFLVDCGSSSRSKVGENVLIPYLKYHGVSKLDGVFLTHPDKDHMSGITELFGQKEIKVGMLYLPKVGERSMEEFDEILDLAPNVRYIEAGDGMKGKEFSITCLHPYGGYEGEGNEYSLCLLLDVRGTRILLTGDVEGKGEEALAEELLRNGVNNIDLLKVAHHGSGNSTSEELLDAMEVKYAIISCGRNNSYGHPHRETLERLMEEGTQVFRTDERGGIRVRL